MSYDFEFDFPAVKVSNIKLRDITLVTESFATIEGMKVFEEEEGMEDFEEEEGMEDFDEEEGMGTENDATDADEEGFKEGKRSRYQKRMADIRSRVARRARNFWTGKKKKKKTTKYYNKYYYLTANLDNRNGSSQLFYNKLHYTFQNIYIVGKTNSNSGANANLIISYKSINDFDNKTPATILYVFFPLNISNTNSSNTNVITGLLDAAYKRNSLINSIDFSSLFRNELYGSVYKFNHYDYLPGSAIANIDVFVFTEPVNVYFSQRYNWITQDIQSKTQTSDPITLSTLNNALNDTKKTDLKGLFNRSLTKEEQIYIQCAPAGASEQTQAVKVDATKSSKKDTDNLSLLISATVVIVVNILIIGLGYGSIYGLLSKFFVRNVIENGRSQRRDSPLSMFLMWILDNGPHFEFMNSAWNNQSRTSSEKLIRVFVFAFYTLILVMILYGYNTRGKRNLVHIAFYILFIFIADVFFFFIQIHNMSIQQYQNLKESSEK